MLMVFGIILIAMVIIAALYSDEIDAFFDEKILQSTDEQIAYISNKLYNDCMSLNNDALDAYKVLIRESVNYRQYQSK